MVTFLDLDKQKKINANCAVVEIAKKVSKTTIGGFEMMNTGRKETDKE